MGLSRPALTSGSTPNWVNSGVSRAISPYTRTITTPQRARRPARLRGFQLKSPAKTGLKTKASLKV